MNGTTISYAYWPAPGGGTVETNGNNASNYYMHKDWLGNSRISSTALNHTIVSDQAYAPYGEVYDRQAITAATPALMFTGDTADALYGIWDTPNRELAAFNSGALAFAGSGSGSGWNQYGLQHQSL